MTDTVLMRPIDLARAALGRTIRPEENIMTISALYMFCGNIPGTNPDAAAEALRAAGYQVFRLPPELKAATCEIEGDDFIEIRREGDADDDAIDAMWADAQRIVAPFEGDVDCVGAASEELFLELTGPLDTRPRWRPLHGAWNTGQALVVDRRRPTSCVVTQRLPGAAARYAGRGRVVAQYAGRGGARYAGRERVLYRRWQNRPGAQGRRSAVCA